LPVARLAFVFLSQNLVDAKLDNPYSADYLSVPDLRAILEDGGAASGPPGETIERQCDEVAKLGTNQAHRSSSAAGRLIPQRRLRRRTSLQAYLRRSPA
jgi:hypothetical protein